ncbi:hypothetical protein DVT68_09745 [Dyella solisilvae]|uniref:Uncharacterized protein n=1 Tax=Dyella solisilvae TaxID=1920168 RepID=A0A370K819_9GAMM|nr:DUF6491 family protein [Dyella solisilvae]RDI98785.1 hypothetical protein DVT68_09745 [Dyella solisilvae]
MRQALLASLMVGALMGCSSAPTLTTQQRLDLYRQHAGAPVMSFRLDNFMGAQSWTPLGDSALALWAGGREYLIELRGTCTGLSTSGRISITNSANQLVTRFDRVVPRTAAPPMGMNACRISSIRPVDSSALRETKAELRNADLIDRASLQSEPDDENPSAHQ